MRIQVNLVLIIAAVFCLAAGTAAQEKPKILPEKKALIAEIIVLTKADQQIVEITDAMLESMETVYPLMVDDLIAKKHLPDGDEARMRTAMLGGYQSFMQSFRKRLPAEVDYRQYIEESYYPLYDKFFTEAELADLVAFYKTSTGQKLVDEMPKIVGESMKLSTEFLMPKIMDLINRILGDEIDKLKNGPPPAHKDQ